MYTIRFGQTVLRTVTKAHCWVLTIVYITLCTISFIRKLWDSAMFDFGRVVLMVVDAVRATVMSYYRLKYLIGRNVVTDILDLSLIHI